MCPFLLHLDHTNLSNFILTRGLGDNDARTIEVSCPIGHTPRTQKELLSHNNPHMALVLKGFPKKKPQWAKNSVSGARGFPARTSEREYHRNEL